MRTKNEAIRSFTLGAGASRAVTISGDFAPETLVVDPDAKVLPLRRKAARARLGFVLQDALGEGHALSGSAP